MKIAILDDYQNVALEMADWTDLKRRAEITVFNDHISDFDALVRRLENKREEKPPPKMLFITSTA